MFAIKERTMNISPEEFGKIKLVSSDMTSETIVIEIDKRAASIIISGLGSDLQKYESMKDPDDKDLAKLEIIKEMRERFVQYRDSILPE